MRAAVFHGREDVRVENVAEPTALAEGDVLIQVTHASICGTDAAEWADGPHLIALDAPHPASGHVGPVVLGHEFTGTVVEAGPAVAEDLAGRRVVCGAGVSCGRCEWCHAGRTNLCARYFTLGLQIDGGLAELVRAPAAICTSVPDECAGVRASLAQPLAVALHALRRSGAGPGTTLAVFGVGGIGSFIVAAAASQEIAPLIAVDVDPSRLETAARLGADLLVDARNDPVATIRGATGGEGPNIVVEASGNPAALVQAAEVTRRGGRLVIVGLQAVPAELDLLALTLREIDVVPSLAHVCDVDLPAAITMLSARDLDRDVVDAVIPLEALVKDGLRPLATGRANGKIVVDLHA